LFGQSLPHSSRPSLPVKGFELPELRWNPENTPASITCLLGGLACGLWLYVVKKPKYNINKIFWIVLISVFLLFYTTHTIIILIWCTCTNCSSLQYGPG
jgi:hypothetical protein